VQARYRGRLGVEVGVIVAADHLRRGGFLTPEQEQIYVDVDAYLQAELPNPPFYDDGNSIGAVTWFKNPAPAEMMARIERLRELLRAHGVVHDVVTSDDPGEIVYEDHFQIGVIPRMRGDQTPMPEGMVLAPVQ
jgi:hypothetical protein